MAELSARSSALHVLDRRDVQRICSGQSVVDLATAVKELVENALDAGASQIEVKLKEFGRDAFEVSDNGAGVGTENFQTLAKKHYTSKISSFEDIDSVASFGFRGEALSSICELASSFSVCTRTKDEAVGALLEYDSSGELKKETKKARPVGTTVTVEELFKPLAVRYKDFHRNIKKHYTKLLKVLQAYAVSCANVKICVFNITGKNANRNVVLATQAHQTMGENIANVFGTKFFRTLLRVEFELRGQPKLEDGNKANESDGAENSDDEQTNSVDTQGEDNLSGQERKVEGYVSKVGAGVGRSDNDRQFFFINGRPFDLPKADTIPTLEEHEWSFDEMIKHRQQYFDEEVEQEQKRKKNRLKVPKACSTSSDGNVLEVDNDVAAAALQRVLKKEDFKRMEVLGQFNLGFIIGKLDNDLFIIDQHASDEKFNYETLQQTTVMHQQPLVRPLMLEVTAGEEMIILDHLDVFAKNGFTFQVNKDAPATKKLKLLSLPFTKHTQFGTEGMLACLFFLLIGC
ncbi:hypothetical protein BBO99_00006819 [Phytophthora kernoviae]|uniref:MutL C-terminal dimerisation domain-containing protein n=1 Tax=Phytophthora kernoviae TaxID=325452 RepID=A0A3R7GWD2_9STRA|nr:hypothetical protein BBI17_006837 [Phytophthora kernoviae]RLN77355.1 hypothetical protein BBO99_00006819 [Phytophthora kernoviae]